MALPSESDPKEAQKAYNLDFLFANEVVQYGCSCGQFRRLNLTYFCKHCMKLRCRSCVAHEVDSQYCQHCLEYIPTIDPKFQMNKCASCYQCPYCMHLLSTSILSVSSTMKEGEKQQPPEIVKKTCQLICEFCRWSSNIFVTEGSKSANNLADFETPNLEKINELVSFFEKVSQREKADKKRRRHHTPGTMDLLKKYGIYNSLSPRLFESLRSRAPLLDKSISASKNGHDVKKEDEPDINSFPIPQARDIDDIEELDENFHYNKEFNIENISSIEQRLAQIELQPERVSEFRPISKSLSVKHSLRCKECERFLCRSEYSPVSIRFKIQSAAYYIVPELRLKSDRYPIKLKMGHENIVEFTLQNQTLSCIKAKLDKIETEEDTYDLGLPPSELSLSRKDDTTDYKHIPFNVRPLNKETQVTFQSPFKIGFYVIVTPKIKSENLTIRFSITHDVPSLQNQKDADKVDRISYIVRSQLGPVN